MIAPPLATPLFLTPDSSSYFNKYLKFSQHDPKAFTYSFFLLAPEYLTVSNYEMACSPRNLFPK